MTFKTGYIAASSIGFFFSALGILVPFLLTLLYKKELLNLEKPLEIYDVFGCILGYVLGGIFYFFA